MNALLLVLTLTAAAGPASGVPAGDSPPRPERQDVPLRLELQATPLAVKFINTGKEPLRILRPLDGSEWGWIMPHYRLTVTDAAGREAKLLPRCKLHGFPYSGTKWPDDYLVTIPPGGSHRQPLGLSHDLPGAGTYTLRFQYLFTPKTDQTPGGPYPAGLWRGQATSNTVTIMIPPG